MALRAANPPTASRRREAAANRTRVPLDNGEIEIRHVYFGRLIGQLECVGLLATMLDARDDAEREFANSTIGCLEASTSGGPVAYLQVRAEMFEQEDPPAGRPSHSVTQRRSSQTGRPSRRTLSGTPSDD